MSGDTETKPRPKALATKRGQSPAVKLGAAKRTEPEAPPAAAAAETVPLYEDNDPAAVAEAQAAEKGREAAWNREPTWQDRRLYPFGSGRESLWLELRTAMGAAPLREVLSTGDGARPFLPDALRLVWLCLHPASDRDARPADIGAVRLLDIRHDLRGLQGRIDEWADAEVPREAQAEIVALGLMLYNDARRNQAKPMGSGDPGGGGGDPSELGESPAR